MRIGLGMWLDFLVRIFYQSIIIIIIIIIVIVIANFVHNGPKS